MDAWALCIRKSCTSRYVLTIVGVVFRLVSLVGKPAFASPAATTLLLLAAAASVVSVRSGTAAHGPVERAPGARPAVMEHEEWGERDANGLAHRRCRRDPRTPLASVAEVRLVRSGGGSSRTGRGRLRPTKPEHGGELVYGYAGGVGIRSGDPKDVERLLLAGYYPTGTGGAKRRTHRSGGGAALSGRCTLSQQILSADARRGFVAPRPKGSPRSARRPRKGDPACRQSLHGVSACHPSGTSVRALGRRGRGSIITRVRAQDISQPTFTTTIDALRKVVESAQMAMTVASCSPMERARR
jgi:hypothetical protein